MTGPERVVKKAPRGAPGRHSRDFATWDGAASNDHVYRHEQWMRTMVCVYESNAEFPSTGRSPHEDGEPGKAPQELPPADRPANLDAPVTNRDHPSRNLLGRRPTIGAPGIDRSGVVVDGHFMTHPTINRPFRTLTRTLWYGL